MIEKADKFGDAEARHERRDTGDEKQLRFLPPQITREKNEDKKESKQSVRKLRSEEYNDAVKKGRLPHHAVEKKCELAVESHSSLRQPA